VRAKGSLSGSFAHRLLIGTLEFVGPNERDGWHLAGIVVPIAYIAWLVWLIALGVLLLT